jgi:hypothetical protein
MSGDLHFCQMHVVSLTRNTSMSEPHRHVVNVWQRRSLYQSAGPIKPTISGTLYASLSAIAPPNATPN